MSSAEPRINALSLFRIQTLMILQKSPCSGYDLAKKLEEILEEKPSTGKIYPFLHQLKENEFIEEIEYKEDTEREKTIYKLTEKGINFVNELLDRAGNIIESRLEQMLDTCKNCLVRLYDSKVIGINDKGDEATFCCVHCMQAYDTGYKIRQD